MTMAASAWCASTHGMTERRTLWSSRALRAYCTRRMAGGCCSWSTARTGHRRPTGSTSGDAVNTAHQLLLFATIGLTSSVVGQDLLWRVEGVGGLIGRGRDLHRMGDFNNDGWEDLLEQGEFWNGQFRT